MKNSSYFKYLCLAVIVTFTSITSCQDYDGDISNLRIEITELRQKIDDINSSIQNGVSIKSVEPMTNGIIITLTNNDTYTITNGEDGSSGADGSIVTIGQNGNWFIDGIDTEKPSKGQDGVPGGYYYPNEDGYWYKVEKDSEEKTSQTWLPTGTITAVLENGKVVLYNVEGSNGPIALGQATLSYLTLIPDFVTTSDGPVVNFSSFTTKCGEIAPATRIRYLVSPSNASVDLVDTDKLYFRYNSPVVLSTKSSAIDPKATFISLEEGILTVEIHINADALEKENSNKIDQILLVAPLKSGGEVNSDWAKVVSSPMSYTNLALVYSRTNGEETIWPSMELTKTVDETKSLANSDARVLNLRYSETVNLKEVIKAMFTEGDWSDFNIDTYNLELIFDLNDEEGDPIVNQSGEGVDQQQYIKLEGTTVTSLVYEIDGIDPPVVNRNPIVRVALRPIEGNLECDVLEGFIKINLTEGDIVDVPPVSFSDEDHIAGCDEFIYRIDSDQMNESFYTPAQKPKEVFHNLYTWTDDSEGVGTIMEVEDTNDAELFNLVWSLTEEEIWNNIGKTVSKTGAYTSGSSIIEVTFTVNIVQPIANLSGLLLEDIWFDNKSYITHNVATTQLNLNDAFKSTEKKLLDLTAAGSQYADYAYEYIFSEEQPITSVDGITISVSSDGKELYANSELIASIAPQTTGEGDILIFNDQSEAAMTLLNKEPEFLKAAIKLLVTNECGRPVIVEAFKEGDSFLIHFYIDIDSGTVYVVPGGTGSGESWDDAMGDIQAAINKATEGNAVWVKGGTYAIERTIVSKNTIDMYGSFAGNETNIEDRPLQADGNSWDFTNPTVLDGQNMRRVMQSTSGITSETIVDGFTFINGTGVSSDNYIDNHGGGIFIGSNFAIYQNCIIRNNTVSGNGAGVAMTCGTVRNSMIESNSQQGEGSGSAVYANTSAEKSSNIIGCVIKGNNANSGTIRNQGAGMFYLKNSKIYSNTAESGSAISVGTVNTEVTNNVIYNNENTVSTNNAIIVIPGGKFYNNTIVNNYGMVYFGNPTNSIEFVNNIYWGNKTLDGQNRINNLSGARNNPNFAFHNNATGRSNDAIIATWNWGENVGGAIGNIEIDEIESPNSNIPEFIKNITFVGAAKYPDEMIELDNANFNISSTSPLKDAGKTISTVTHDIEGTSRPQGAAYDIGAYEATE